MLNPHQSPISRFQTFAFKYFGLFSVTAKIGAAAYRLALPPDSKN